MSMGQRIAALRKEKGFTQEYLAQQLSVSRQAVGKWEKNLSAPDTSNLIALSQILGCSVEYLTTGEAGLKTPEAPLPFPFARLSMILFCVGLCFYLFGVFSGFFEHMLMIPAGNDGIGTLLYYGDEPEDIAILSIACVFVILSIVFAFLHRRKR